MGNFDQKASDAAQKEHGKHAAKLVKEREEAAKDEPVSAPPSVATTPTHPESRVSVKIGGKEQVKRIGDNEPNTAKNPPAEQVKEEAAAKAGLKFTTAVPKGAATHKELKGGAKKKRR
jgi:hypothetical protein